MDDRADTENPIVGEISAVSVDSTRFVTANVSDYFAFRGYDDGRGKYSLPVISIWMKGTGTLISWGVNEGLYDTDSKQKVKFVVNDTTVALEGTSSAAGTPDGNAYGSWTKPSDDGQWHHYFIVRVNNTVNSDSIDVWRDGSPLTGSGSLSTYMSASYGTQFGIGTAKTYNNSSPYYADRVDWSTACYAQVWIGYIDCNATDWTDTNAWVNEFYHNGAVDLSPTQGYSKTFPSNGITGGGSTFVFDKLTYPFSTGDCDFWLTNSDAHGDKGYKVSPTADFICTNNWISPHALNFHSNFSVFPGLSRIKTGASHPTSRFTIRAVTGPVKQFRATLSSRFTVSAQGRSTQQVYARNITARATISKATANPIKKTTKTLNAVFTVRAHNTVAVFASAHITTAKFTVKVKTSATAKTLRSQFSLYVHPMRVQRATVVLPVNASVHANGGLYFNGHFGITSVCILRAKLTVVPKVDDLLTVPVDAESRCLRTLEELRLSTLQTQSRVNRTIYEDRCLVVTDESRTVREAVAPVLETTSLRIRRTVT